MAWTQADDQIHEDRFLVPFTSHCYLLPILLSAWLCLSLYRMCVPHTFHLRFSFPSCPPWRFYNSLWLLNEMHNRFQHDSIHYEWLIFVCLSPPKLRSRVIKSYNFKYYLTASKQNGFLTSQQNICHSLLTNNCYLADWQHGHFSMIGREMKRKILFFL